VTTFEFDPTFVSFQLPLVGFLHLSPFLVTSDLGMGFDGAALAVGRGADEDTVLFCGVPATLLSPLLS
jgi:hypothetical protein